jgi:hypothetical protein
MRALTSTEEICVRSHVSPDGSSYEGEVISACPSPCPACLAFFAFSHFTFPQWINGKREGKGVCQYAHSTYEGEWKENVKHGYGKITYAG